MVKYVFTLFILAVLCCDELHSASFRAVQKRLQKTTVRFFNSLGPGICAQIILNATVRNQYIAKSLVGRVQPVGTFSTSSTALEYLYGLLCDIPGLPERQEVLTSYKLPQLTYDANYYRVSFKLQLNLKSTRKMLFFGMLAFNENWKLCGYEAAVQNLGLTLDFNSTIRPALVQRLCQGIQVVCPVGSANQQYANMSDCLSFLSEPRTPFGTYDRADQNNVVCRLIHIQLAQIDPTTHCPHVGKDGGGKCTNKPYTYYFQDPSDFLTCAHQYRS